MFSRSSMLIVSRVFARTPFGRFLYSTVSPASGSVDEKEIERFSKLASSWWDENGPLKALHAMNQVRVPWIRDTLKAYGLAQKGTDSECLGDVRILDVGCGAGILSEPLARLGANVVGVDATEECIGVAKIRLEKDRKLREKIRYVAGTVEELRLEEKEKFEAVVASEIVEHVGNREEFLRSCVEKLKPGGVIFITTLNKTWLAQALGIFVAERILRIVPEGTHEIEKFTPPQDLKFMIEREGCSVRMIHGLGYNPITNRWAWIRNTSINYGLHAVKIK